MKMTKARPMHKDYYEYRTMTVKKYEKMKKVKLFYDEWVAVEMGIEQVLLRRFKGWEYMYAMIILMKLHGL